MDSKLVAYLKRIVKTIGIGLLWMAINVRIGIMAGYAFVEIKLTTVNIIFYTWFVISLAAMLFAFYKIWKNDLHFETDSESTNTEF